MIKNIRLNKAGSVPENGKNPQNQTAVEDGKKMSSDYSVYPPRDDIYNKGKKVDLNPEDLSKNKEPEEKPGKIGSDLDVPGSELDDKQESVGSEDEENNYYSLGGDGHNDLDED